MSYLIELLKWIQELIARPFYYHIAYDSIVWQTAFCFKGFTVSFATIIVILALVLAGLLFRNYVSVVGAITTFCANVPLFVQLFKRWTLIKAYIYALFLKIKNFLKNMF